MKVTPYGRLTFLVQSQSNESIQYLVDLTTGNGECDCCDFQLRAKRKTGAICKHVKTVRDYLADTLIEQMRKQEHGN